MLKKFGVSLFCLMLFLIQSGLAFAGTTEEKATTEENTVIEEDTAIEEITTVDETIVDGYGEGGGGMYYGGYNGFYFSISTKSYANPETIVLYGDYYPSSYNDKSLNTRKAMLAHLNSVYSTLNEELNVFGTLTQTGINVYNSYMSETESSFDGYLSVRLDLTDLKSLPTVKSIFSELSVNYWLDAIVAEEDKINAEALVAEKLKTLIDKKKSVYEIILGYTLTKIISLNVYSWPDASFYNSETGLVPLTVYADVTYSSEE